MPIFGDIARMFQNQGPVNWDVARQLGGYMAADGKPEANVDPLERIRLGELARVPSFTWPRPPDWPPR